MDYELEIEVEVGEEPTEPPMPTSEPVEEPAPEPQAEPAPEPPPAPEPTPDAALAARVLALEEQVAGYKRECQYLRDELSRAQYQLSDYELGSVLVEMSLPGSLMPTMKSLYAAFVAGLKVSSPESTAPSAASWLRSEASSSMSSVTPIIELARKVAAKDPSTQAPPNNGSTAKPFPAFNRS